MALVTDLPRDPDDPDGDVEAADSENTEVEGYGVTPIKVEGGERLGQEYDTIPSSLGSDRSDDEESRRKIPLKPQVAERKAKEKAAAAATDEDHSIESNEPQEREESRGRTRAGSSKEAGTGARAPKRAKAAKDPRKAKTAKESKKAKGAKAHKVGTTGNPTDCVDLTDDQETPGFKRKRNQKEEEVVGIGDSNRFPKATKPARTEKSKGTGNPPKARLMTCRLPVKQRPNGKAVKAKKKTRRRAAASTPESLEEEGVEDAVNSGSDSATSPNDGNDSASGGAVKAKTKAKRKAAASKSESPEKEGVRDPAPGTGGAVTPLGGKDDEVSERAARAKKGAKCKTAASETESHGEEEVETAVTSGGESVTSLSGGDDNKDEGTSKGEKRVQRKTTTGETKSTDKGEDEGKATSSNEAATPMLSDENTGRDVVGGKGESDIGDDELRSESIDPRGDGTEAVDGMEDDKAE
jgi:hypothetical protein